MLLDALRKTIMDAIGGYKILLDLFYRKPVYVGDDCVEYGCMELKHDDDQCGKKVFIFLELVAKVRLSECNFWLIFR